MHKPLIAKQYNVWLWLVPFCLVLGGWLSVELGQDANWDWMNYHVYNPWALLHHRADVDLFAAGIQTYFNPALDLPYYFLAFEWLPDKPRLVAFIMGLPYGVLAFLTLRCAYIVLADFEVQPWARPTATVLAALFGMSGAASVSQIGTTFNEIPLAALMIAGVAILLSGLHDTEQRFDWHSIFLAGGLFGLAAGFKLTAAIYAPAAVLSLIAVTRKGWVKAAVLFSLGWGIGFCLADGWWALRLNAQTGNPLFPFFQHLFEKKLTLPIISFENITHGPLKDRPSIWQLPFYAFAWARPNAGVVTEPPFSDPRFAIASLALMLILAILMLGRLKLIEDVPQHRMPRTTVFVLVFVTSSYLIWLKISPALRYSVSIEVLLGLVVTIGIIVSVRRVFRRSGEIALIIGMLFLIYQSAKLTIYPKWGRVIPYHDVVLRIGPVKLPPNALILLLEAPEAYVVPSIAADNPTAQFGGIFDPGFIKQNMVDTHAGPIYGLARLNTRKVINVLSELGLEVDNRGCYQFSSSVDSGFKICRLLKSDRPKHEVASTPAVYPAEGSRSEWASSKYELGTLIKFGGGGDSERFRVSGWSSTEDLHTWTEGNSAVLNFSGLPRSQPLMLKMTIAGLTKAPALPAQPTEIYANGKKIAGWQVADKREYVASIPADAVSSTGTLTLEFRVPKAASPKSLGINPDWRQLALGVFDLVIEQKP